jgi:hypothetical protein
MFSFFRIRIHEVMQFWHHCSSGDRLTSEFMYIKISFILLNAVSQQNVFLLT